MTPLPKCAPGQDHWLSTLRRFFTQSRFAVVAYCYVSGNYKPKQSPKYLPTYIQKRQFDTKLFIGSCHTSPSHPSPSPPPPLSPLSPPLPPLLSPPLSPLPPPPLPPSLPPPLTL